MPSKNNRATSLTVARPFGISIEVHWSWLLLASLIAASLATGWFPEMAPGHHKAIYWLCGALCAVGLFLSITLHELSHAVVGRAYRMPIRKITLFLFGGVAHLEGEPPSPKSEILMSLAGPAMSVVLAVGFWTALFLADSRGADPMWLAALSYLSSINVVVAVFNMLPGYPLDGGRVLRAVVWWWKKDVVAATKVASGIGQFIGLLLLAVGIASALSGYGASGVWATMLGVLLVSFARSSYVQLVLQQSLQGKPAERFMEPAHRILAADALRDTESFVRNDEPEHQIAPETDAVEALARMTRYGYHELLVTKGGKLLGVLTQTSLLKAASAPAST